MKVVFSDEAKADLVEIGDRIARSTPLRAASFVRELRKAAQQLGEMPRAFPVVARYEHYDIRRRPYGDYLVFYRIDDYRIAIVHILHGARDYESLLFPET